MLQPQRAKTLISVFLTRFRYFSYQSATQLSSRALVGPVPDSIFSEKFQGHSKESNRDLPRVSTSVKEMWSSRVDSETELPQLEQISFNTES